jgi:glutathione synthase/RimK-type ligase-like ATP-grasp enzyme
MARGLIVVDRPERWPFVIEDVETVAARAYLTEDRFHSMKGVRVYNACRSYAYHRTGYYVSLLAEARGHRPLPSISTIQDTRFQSIFRSLSSDLDDLINKSLCHLQSDEFELSIYFSHNTAKHYDRLCKALYQLFPAPFIRAFFEREKDLWRLRNISLISAAEVSAEHREVIPDLAKRYFESKDKGPKRKKPARYSMAILVDPDESHPPSDGEALRRFVRAAERFSIECEMIGREDYGRLAEFHALFIRQTTAVNDITYRMARKAEAEGLVVIDDPSSIIKCTNKVFLAELCERYGVPGPKTWILQRDNLEEIAASVTFPVILKDPDSSFSLGVFKADSPEAFIEKSQELLKDSELLIAQEFVKTDFDWRIGIIDNRPFYACKYFMARGHWQIYDHSQKEDARNWGRWETIPIELAPVKVVRTAVKAAKLIGDGFYGVDLKQSGNQCTLIEINDNPSIEHGVEDMILKNTLYERVMEVFARRLDARMGITHASHPE